MDTPVVVANVRVVEAPRRLEPVFCVRELPREVAEGRARLELGIRLGDGDEPPRRRPELVLGRRTARCDLAGTGRLRAEPCDLLQRFALVARVTADVRHEVRDELVTAPQLGIYIRPGLADEGARGDEIVERDERRVDEQQDVEGQAGEERFVHAADPYSAKTARGIRS